MLEFLTLKPDAFALDISDTSLKIAKLKRGNKGLFLASFAEVPLGPGIVMNGNVKDEGKLAEAIKRAVSQVKGEKIRTKNVIASLPEKKAFLEIIQMPLLAEEDLKSAVIFEAENYIPLPIEEVYLDSQVVSPLLDHLDRQDILIAALPRNIVTPYVGSLKKAGLIPQIFEIESLSIARSLIKGGVSSSPVLIIDLGMVRTSLVVFSDCSVRFTFSIPVSVRDFTKAICRQMKVDLKEAEKLRTEFGLEGRKTKKGSQIFDALIPSLTDLVEQIKKYLEYYNTYIVHENPSVKEKRIEKILLSGEGASLKGLVDFFSSQLGSPVSFGDPWVNITGNGEKGALKLPLEKSLSFATALGLALKAAEENDQ